MSRAQTIYVDKKEKKKMKNKKENVKIKRSHYKKTYLKWLRAQTCIFKLSNVEAIIFAINLDVASSSKGFKTFDYVFLIILLLTRINKVIFIFFKVLYKNDCQ